MIVFIPLFLLFVKGEEPLSVPISIPITEMTHVSGNYGCYLDVPCSIDNPIAECGYKCWSVKGDNHAAAFEYTFKGEKFQVYGTYKSGHGNYTIYLDGNLLATINQNSATELKYKLQYTSPVLPYGPHTIEIKGIGQAYEITKIAYWPSVNAIRINATEFESHTNNEWQKESDGIGGVRLHYFKEKNHYYRISHSYIKFTKVWIYGSRNTNLDSFTFKISNQETEVEDFPVDESHTSEINNTLLHESKYFNLRDYMIAFTPDDESKEVIVNCLYYIDTPEPKEPDLVPFSVPVNYMTRAESESDCSVPVECEKSLSKPSCGTVCQSKGDNRATYEYVFKGEKFQVYGNYDPSLSYYDIFIDDIYLSTVNQKDAHSNYRLQYSSPIFGYGEHKIKIAGKGRTFTIYKIAFWPSLDAVRLNSTDISPPWHQESDRIGGLNEWVNDNDNDNILEKSATLTCSKIWIYGITEPNHGTLDLSLNDNKIATFSETSPSRIEFVLVHETDYFNLDTYTMKIKYNKDGPNNGGAVLYCIYYLPIQGPEEPPTISVPVPIQSMTIVGDKTISTPTQCPSGTTIATQPCGDISQSTIGHTVTYEYSFRGVKCQVFGSYGPSNGAYNIYVDDKFMLQVNQHKSEQQNYILQYSSGLLPYGTHTIKAVGIGNQFEIYKFAYWPSLEATRVNISDFNLVSGWTKESDKFGGVRAYTGGTGGTATTNVVTDKIWIYGSLNSGHQSGKMQIGDFEGTFNEHMEGEYTDRKDFYLVYETPSDFTFKSGELTISSSQIILISFIFYANTPFPSPSQSPTQSPSQSPTESPSQSPTESPSQSPTESPSQSPTESPIPTPIETQIPVPTRVPLPTDDPDRIYVFEENATSSDGRYHLDVSNDKRTVVSIQISQFINISSELKGGGIHITNAGLQCDQILFRNCTSGVSGGAIYIHNVYDIKNEVNLKNLDISECKAQYGGAIYIYSHFESNVVSIVSSKFTENVALAGVSDEHLFGGSAIYLTAHNGTIKRCKFNNNQGEGGSVKLYNHFENLDQNALKYLNKEELREKVGNLVISECQFNVDQSSSNALFYLKGKKGANLELVDCEFNGNLALGSHYIEGECKEKNSPNLIVKNCRFSSSISKALNLDSGKNYLSINLKNQVFALDEIKKSSFAPLKVALMIAVPAAVVALIVGFVVFAIKRSKQKKVQGNEESVDLNEILINNKE